MNTFILGTLGEHTPTVPASLAVIFELITGWSETPSRTELGFICAAAIAHSVEHPNKPKYKYSVSMKEYGRECIEWLLGAGVSIPDIYSYGSLMLALSMDKLPTQKGAEEKADFLPQQDAESLNT